MNQSASTTTSSQSEPEEVRRALQQTWKEIEHVDDQMKAAMELIERTHASLKTLQSSKEQLLTVAATTASQLSTFQILPSDAMDEIARNLVASRSSVYSLSRDIWSLTHVCRSWRSALLSLGRLWSTFRLSDRTRSISPELVSTILLRSGMHSLSFSVSFYKNEADYTALSLLTEQSERWKDVYILAHGPLPPLKNIRGHLPCLESLYLDLRNGRNWTEEDRLIFKDAPSLRKLGFTYAISFPRDPFHFPLEGLRDLSCSWNPRDGSVELCELGDLSQYSSLVRLDLTGRIVDGNWGPPAPFLSQNEILLPTLEYFRTTGHAYLLALFRTPSLKKLTLIHSDIDQGIIAVSAPFFDSITSGQLTDFVFDGEHSELHTDLQALLSFPAFQSLHTLEVRKLVYIYMDEYRQTPWISSLLRKLTYEEGRAFLLPRLRKIILEFDAILGEDYIFSPLRDFVSSRTRLVDEAKNTAGNMTAVGPGDPDGQCMDSDQFFPARLESVYFQFKSNSTPITLSNFHLLEKGLVPQLEVFGNSTNIFEDWV